MVPHAAYPQGAAAYTLYTEMLRAISQYVKQERRRAGYFQADVAYLLGARARTKVGRYERGKHLPPLPSALAYEVLFGIPVAELFPGAFSAARRVVRRRARRRIAMLAKLPETPRNLRRKRSLEAMLADR